MLFLSMDWHENSYDSFWKSLSDINLDSLQEFGDVIHSRIYFLIISTYLTISQSNTMLNDVGWCVLLSISISRASSAKPNVQYFLFLFLWYTFFFFLKKIERRPNSNTMFEDSGQLIISANSLVGWRRKILMCPCNLQNFSQNSIYRNSDIKSN